MADENRFMTELLRGIQDGIKDLQGRMGALERRQTAGNHLDESVIAHIAGVHESIDNLRAEVHRMNERLVDVERVVHAR
jgi:hypothetical protein